MARRRSSSRRGGGNGGGANWVDIGVLWESKQGSRAEMSGKINAIPTNPKWDGSISIFPASDKAGFDFKICAAIQKEEEEEEDSKGSRRGRRSRRDQNEEEDDEEEGDDFEGDSEDDDEGEPVTCGFCGETVGPGEVYCPYRNELKTMKIGGKPAKCSIGLALDPEEVKDPPF